MEWQLIRRHYALLLAEARRAGATQQSIAAAGGLAGQNAISKLLANQNLGPSVETFAKAVKGLGMDLSTFFAQIEHAKVASATDAHLLHRIRELEHTNEQNAAGAGAPPQHIPEGSPNVDSSISPTTDGGEHTRLEALVKEHFAILERRLGRLDRVAEYLELSGSADDRSDPAAPNGRANHRRRSRKLA